MLLEQTIHSPLPVGTMRWYAFAPSDVSSAPNTEIASAQPTRNPLLPRLGSSTINEPEPTGEFFSVRIPDTEPLTTVVEQTQRSYVEGVVQRYDEASVRCVLTVEGQEVSVQLQKALFPDKIRHGLPFKLEMIDDSGFRQPLVTIRSIDARDAEAIAEAFDEILAAI